MKPLHIEQPSSTINVHNALTSNIIHENILTTLENPSPHRDKYFQQLLDTPIHPCMCCHQLCFFKKTRKILKSMIQKILYMIHLKKKFHYCVKVVILFFIKIKHQSFLFLQILD
jgi:hypothetical protein